MLCWAQTWTEREMGWGERPDGYTLHAKKTDIRAFLDAMRAHEAKQYGEALPKEYSYPDALPALVEITDEETIKRLRESEHGIWGLGVLPPISIGVANDMIVPETPHMQLLNAVKQMGAVRDALSPAPKKPKKDPGGIMRKFRKLQHKSWRSR